MPLRRKEGFSMYDGYTWNPSIAPNDQFPVPCYELHWDEEGRCARTGRYALLLDKEVRWSESVEDEGRHLARLEDSDSRIVDKETFMRIRADHVYSTPTAPARYLKRR